MNHYENVDINSSTKLAPSACNIHHGYRIELDNGVQRLVGTSGRTPKGRAAASIYLRLEDGEGAAELAVVGGSEEGDELVVGEVLVSVLHHLVPLHMMSSSCAQRKSAVTSTSKVPDTPRSWPDQSRWMETLSLISSSTQITLEEPSAMSAMRHPDGRRPERDGGAPNQASTCTSGPRNEPPGLAKMLSYVSTWSTSRPPVLTHRRSPAYAILMSSSMARSVRPGVEHVVSASM
jgi:hypothetical protein